MNGFHANPELQSLLFKGKPRAEKPFGIVRFVREGASAGTVVLISRQHLESDTPDSVF